ncbi:MAG: histidine-type phosphatase [Muribaculaceae bacterium]|nr:histidine-type phosphatase [Muribaculaceae bacterium]
MRHRLSVAVLLVLAALCCHGGVRDDFRRNVRCSAGNYWAYPDSDLPALTPAPEGYTPFFINHYGRHGSRWLIGKRLYNFPVEQLELGEQAGKLTHRGQEVLDILRRLRQSAEGRDGELSDIGHEQHQRIARRMVENFPEVWQGQPVVRARSTVVIRCILSMQNEVDVLKSLNPDMSIYTDASQAEMYYMNYSDPVVKPLRKAAYHYFDEFKDRHIKPNRFLKKLFTDAKWAERNIQGADLMVTLFDVVGNMQSHHEWEGTDLYDLYTADEVYWVWAYNNVRWYIFSGLTPLTQSRVPYMEANLLRSFIEDADRAIAHPGNSASLRFGHESVVLPLVCLMGINGADYQTTDLETLDRHWRNYEVFPMACNLQMVYYRPDNASGDILVKVLLNEREATLPVTTEQWPYYRWKDVRDFYMDRLTREPLIQPVIQ